MSSFVCRNHGNTHPYSETRWNQVPELLPEEVCTVDSRGTITRLTRTWRDRARENSLLRGLIEGEPFQKVCSATLGMSEQTALHFLNGLHAILRGARRVFSIEYAPSQTPQVRMIAWAARTLSGDGDRVVIAREDVTARRRLEEHFREHSRRAHRIPPSPTPRGSENGSAPEFAQEQLLAEVEGDCRVLRDMVAAFAEALPLAIARITEALHRQDRQTARTATHNLLSSTTQFCAEPACAALLAFEKALSEDELGQGAKLLPALETRLSNLLLHLQAFVDRFELPWMV